MGVIACQKRILGDVAVGAGLISGITAILAGGVAVHIVIFNGRAAAGVVDAVTTKVGNNVVNRKMIFMK